MRLLYTFMLLQISARFTGIQMCCGEDETTARYTRQKPKPTNTSKPENGDSQHLYLDGANFVLYNAGINYAKSDNSWNIKAKLKSKSNCVFIIGRDNLCYGIGLPKSQAPQKERPQEQKPDAKSKSEEEFTTCVPVKGKSKHKVHYCR